MFDVVIRLHCGLRPNNHSIAGDEIGEAVQLSSC